MQRIPLRYSITDWHQLSRCLSNNSRKLSIKIADIEHYSLQGLRIQVVHEDIGVMFSTIINAHGDLITHSDSRITQELTTESILSELHRFGFFIKYCTEFEMTDEQRKFLESVRDLGFSMIRLLNVHDDSPVIKGKESNLYLVAFKPEAHGAWWNNAYSPSMDEFQSALVNGTAINCTEASKYRWNWLNFVGNIDKLLHPDGEEV